jgi:hypothetical protein
MLHPKNDRIDYGEQLIPPDGYELAYAIGTTYSLDLEALMILPVALFYAQKLDGNPDDLRYDMLEAITKASDKITIFYQNGQLKVPQKYHYLMSYWEKGIRSITMPNYVSSFHPKVWVIRYENKERLPKYRVLITSRNLTLARDWDMAFSTDGSVTDRDQTKNKPLVDFLNYLNIMDLQDIPSSFLSDLLKVEFDIPEKFESFKFVPVGVKNPNTAKSYLNPLTASKINWDEMLIISPFVDKTTLEKIYNYTERKPYLLSRKEELDGVPEVTLSKFDCWQFSSFFQEAEFYQELEEEGVEPVAQNLHAKLFVAMSNKIPYWYLGSANCSDPAQGRNIEFMVELKGIESGGLKTKDILKVLTDPTKSEGITLFTPYQLEARVSVEEQKNLDSAIRKIKYALTLMSIKGEAKQIEGGTAYNLTIEIDASELDLPNDFQIKVKPLPEQQKTRVALKSREINVIKDFGGYAETSLSIFLEFEISYKDLFCRHFLLPMEIGLPSSRLNKIFSSIINSRDKFLKYLTFLLTGEETDLIGNAVMQRNDQYSRGRESASGTPVYEKLLITTSRYPEKLKSIDDLINRLKGESSDLDEQIITEDFENFWHVFQPFIIKKNKR